MREVLYRKSFSGPLLRCLANDEAIEVLNAIHHSRGRSLAHKAITAGYFWPYMMQDAMKFVKRCNEIREKKREVSETCSSNSSAFGAMSFGSKSLALRQVGIGYYWKVSNREDKKIFRASCDRLFYQLG